MVRSIEIFPLKVGCTYWFYFLLLSQLFWLAIISIKSQWYIPSINMNNYSKLKSPYDYEAENDPLKFFYVSFWLMSRWEAVARGWKEAVGGWREVPGSLWIEALEKNQAAIENNSLFPPSSRAAGCNPLWSSLHSKWRKRFRIHPSDSIGNNKIINHMNDMMGISHRICMRRVSIDQSVETVCYYSGWRRFEHKQPSHPPAAAALAGNICVRKGCLLATSAPDLIRFPHWVPKIPNSSLWITSLYGLLTAL